MSHLKACFNSECNQCSPVPVDKKMVVNYDEDGNEVITFVPVDYDKIRTSNGSVKDWSLNALLKAGINPNMPIHTGLNTRLAGVGVINDAAAALDSILAEDSAKTD